MKKFIKSIFVLFFTLLMICNSIICINADSSLTDRQKAINVLLQAGWTITQIEDLLTEEALLAYADVESVVSFDEKYMKITDDEVIELTERQCFEEITEIYSAKNNTNSRSLGGGDQIIDTVTTSCGYLEYYVSVYSYGNGEYMVSARFEWLIDPQNRKHDVFGLGHSYNLTQLSDFDVYYIYKYDMVNGNVNSGTYEVTEPETLHIDDGGTVIVQKLAPNSSLGNMTYSNHRGFIQYKVGVNSTSATVVSVYAEYLHQQAVFAVNPSVSYPMGASISVSSSTKFKVMSPNPYLAFEVN